MLIVEQPFRKDRLLVHLMIHPDWQRTMLGTLEQTNEWPQDLLDAPIMNFHKQS
jgi:hypothetical protein